MNAIPIRQILTGEVNEVRNAPPQTQNNQVVHRQLPFWNSMTDYFEVLKEKIIKGLCNYELYNFDHPRSIEMRLEGLQVMCIADDVKARNMFKKWFSSETNPVRLSSFVTLLGDENELKTVAKRGYWDEADYPNTYNEREFQAFNNIVTYYNSIQKVLVHGVLTSDRSYYPDRITQWVHETATLRNANKQFQTIASTPLNQKSYDVIMSLFTKTSFQWGRDFQCMDNLFSNVSKHLFPSGFFVFTRLRSEAIFKLLKEGINKYKQSHSRNESILIASGINFQWEGDFLAYLNGNAEAGGKAVIRFFQTETQLRVLKISIDTKNIKKLFKIHHRRADPQITIQDYFGICCELEWCGNYLESNHPRASSFEAFVLPSFHGAPILMQNLLQQKQLQLFKEMNPDEYDRALKPSM